LGQDVPPVTLAVTDGQRVTAGTGVAQIAGPGHVVLIAERTILNLMSRASGIATHTRRWADALEGTGARVLDTRKTTPGLRALEKYAVRRGGGVNKRMGLYDCAMVKDNHIVAAGSVAGAVAAIADAFPGLPIQVEVENWSQIAEALGAGVRFLMLDNMEPAEMAEVVARVRALEPTLGPGLDAAANPEVDGGAAPGTRVRLEATGGLTLANAREVAATGVDFMSVGGLTHSSPILDLALDLH